MTAPALWRAGDAVVASSGTATADWAATGVSIDSRTLAPGDMFVALDGPSRDGHQFVADALRRGAAAAMVTRRPEGVADDAPLLIVEDTLAALEALGTARRRAVDARVAAVTGSVGKTGSKEALRKIFADQGRCHASEASYNNQWGVPLSLARMPQDSEFAIFELGMNHAGELGPLSRMVRPHVVLITTIAPVHLEFFASERAIAAAKAEIFEGVEPGGTVVLNHDNSHFHFLADAARAAGIGHVVSFGSHPESDVLLKASNLFAGFSCVHASVNGQAVAYRVGLPGQHWVENSLGVLGVVAAMGGDLARAALSLGQLAPIKGRGRRHRVIIAGGGFEVIDESYNANPASMRAAFAVLGQSEVKSGGRRVAVLGDMLELGANAGRLHAELAPALLVAGVDQVFLCGANMAALASALPPERLAAHEGDAAKLRDRVLHGVHSGDVVLIKGSLGSRMAPIVEALLHLGHAPEMRANG